MTVTAHPGHHPAVLWDTAEEEFRCQHNNIHLLDHDNEHHSRMEALVLQPTPRLEASNLTGSKPTPRVEQLGMRNIMAR